MRWIVIPVLIFGGGLAAVAQMPSVPDQAAAMAELDGMVGTWEGAGWMQQGPDPASKVEFTVREEVEAALDGLVLLVRGRGWMRPDPEAEPFLGHDALATIHWNEAEGRYDFQTHTLQGHHLTTELERLPDGSLRWGFDVPNGAVRYTISVADGRWSERGEITFDGETWLHFHEMALERIEG